MGRIFSDENRFKQWLEVELAASEALARPWSCSVCFWRASLVRLSREIHQSTRSAFASTEPVANGSAPARRHRLHHDPVQDTAIYNCSCGFVFEAEVQTTVGCPHCGGSQAW